MVAGGQTNDATRSPRGRSCIRLVIAGVFLAGFNDGPHAGRVIAVKRVPAEARFMDSTASPGLAARVFMVVRRVLLLAAVSSVAALALPGAAAANAEPTVTEAALSSSAGADRTYALGDEIRVRLTFSEAVEVTGTPGLKIDFRSESGGEKVAAYAGGSGKAMLEFAYEVVAQDVSTQGVAVLTNTLALNGGTIRSASTTRLPADLAHAGLGHDADHKVDGIPPTLERGEADGGTITAFFSEALDEDSVGGIFKVTLEYPPKGGEVFNTTGKVEISGKTVVIGLGGGRRARVGGFVHFWYRAPTNPTAKKLRDLAGNTVRTPNDHFSDEMHRSTRVISLDNRTSLPSPERATVNRDRLALTFDAPLDEDSVPVGGAFTVKAGTSEVSLASASPVAVAGDTVTLTLASAVASGDTVTVSYTKPSRKPLRNVVGEPAKGFTDETVTNVTPDAGSPTVTGVTLSLSAGADRTYAFGDEIRVRLTFSEVVEVTGTPGLEIDFRSESGGEQVAAYAGGTGEAVLEFAYEVGASDVSTQGVAVLGNTLALNGGTIRSASTTRLHADLAHAGLGHDANHRVDGMVPSLRSAAVDGATLTLTFSEALDEASVPANSAFGAKKTPRGGIEETVSLSGSPALDGAVVTLTLANAVAGTDTVEVSYRKPPSGIDNELRDAAGNEVESFGPETVTNDTPTLPTPRPPPPTNFPPVADAGADVAVEPGAAVRLDGSGSADPDGDALTFAWSQVSGEAVELQGADTATPSFEAPAAPGVLTFRLTVSDAGALSASDTVAVRVGSLGAVHHVPLLPAASHPYRQGFVRIVNRSAEAGEVYIVAIDDAGVRTGAVTLSMGARAAAHLTSSDLEEGNAERGLSGRVGEGEGDWRLELESALDLEVLAYVRTRGAGALASMHDVVPEDEAGRRVVFFNPASNRGRVSWLRLVNPGEEAAVVRISGIDDAGEAGESAVTFTLAGRASRALSAQALESGVGEGLTGALGDGTGKWRLRVTADRPIRAMSLLASGPHLTNVSTAPERIREE